MNSTIIPCLIEPILDKILLNVRKIYGNKLKQIILYGSYARGQQDAESDIDIVVLVDMNENKLKKYEEKLNNIVCEISYEYMKVISLIDISYNKYINWIDVVPFYKNIYNEGVKLYG